MSAAGLPCPVCGERSTALRYRLVLCDLHGCSRCTHLFSVRRPGVAAEAYSDDYFDERHREYFENPDTELFGRTLERLERHWKPGGNVVDVGCGPGNWLEFLRAKGYAAYGVELSAAAAETARSKGFQVSSVEIADYEPPVPMDGMMSWYVLEHIEDVADFVAHSARKLRPGGVAVFATVDSGSLIYALGKLLHRMTLGRLRAPLQRICEIHHVQHFTGGSLTRLLEDGGFALLERFSAPFPAQSVNASPLQRLLVRIAYAMATPFGSHIIQVVVASRRPESQDVRTRTGREEDPPVPFSASEP